MKNKEYHKSHISKDNKNICDFVFDLKSDMILNNFKLPSDLGVRAIIRLLDFVRFYK